MADADNGPGAQRPALGRSRRAHGKGLFIGVGICVLVALAVAVATRTAASSPAPVSLSAARTETASPQHPAMGGAVPDGQSVRGATWSVARRREAQRLADLRYPNRLV